MPRGKKKQVVAIDTTEEVKVVESIEIPTETEEVEAIQEPQIKDAHNSDIVAIRHQTLRHGEVVFTFAKGVCVSVKDLNGRNVWNEITYYDWDGAHKEYKAKK